MPNYGQLINQATPDAQTKKPAAGLFEQLGILSPAEKRAQEIQTQMAERAMQMQMAAQQQAMHLAQANAKANIPTGFNAAPFMASGGLMDIQNAQRATKAMQGGMPGMGTRGVQGNAPGSMRTPGFAPPEVAGEALDPAALITESLRQYPNDQATGLRVAGQKLLAAGQMRQDGELMKIGSNLMMKAQEVEKDQLDIEGKKVSNRASKIDANKKVAPGSMENSRDAAGNIRSTRQTFDSEGNYLGDEQTGLGPNKQITTTEEDPRTATQRGDEYQKFQHLLVNTDATVSSMRDITSNLEKGAAQGWAAGAVTLLDNAAGTLAQLAPGSRLNAQAEAALASASGTFQEWADKTGVNESIWNDLVSNLAKTYNPTGTITEKDITRAARTVGQNISNPKTVAKVLRDAERRSRGLVDKTYKYMSKDAQDASKAQYDRFLQSWTPGAEGDAEEDMPASDSAEPSWDDAPAGTSAPKNEQEYDALAAGTKYWNPYLKKVLTKKAKK